MNRADKFHARLASAQPGTDYVYYVGHLAVDREHDPEIDEVARAAWDAYEAGFVELVQERWGDRFAYVSYRTTEILG